MSAPIAPPSETAAPAVAPGNERSAKRAVIAAGLGTMLEHYDLSIYGFLAVIMGPVFFPTSDPAVSLLVTFLSFGLAFLSRPIGALVLGEYGDRRGRKKALALSLELMGVGSILMAVLPTYASVGALAPIGVMLARLIQGFSAGGEGAVSPVFMAEQNPGRRAFYPSLLIAFGNGTKVLSAGMGALCALMFTEAEMREWAWRIPFLLGALILPVSIYVRRAVPESREFLAQSTAAAGATPPARSRTAEVFRSHKVMMLAQIGVGAQSSTTFYFNLFLPTYAMTVVGLPMKEAFWPSLLMGLISAVIAPYAGLLADRIGRFRVMLFSSLAVTLVYLPLYTWILAERSLVALLVAQVGCSVITALYNGGSSGIAVELFPTHVRATASGLSIAVAKTVFGGFALAVFQGLLTLTGIPIAPLFFVVFAGAISTGSALFLWHKGRIR